MDTNTLFQQSDGVDRDLQVFRQRRADAARAYITSETARISAELAHYRGLRKNTLIEFTDGEGKTYTRPVASVIRDKLMRLDDLEAYAALLELDADESATGGSNDGA